MEYTTRVKYSIYTIEANFRGPYPFLSKTTKIIDKLNPLDDQQNEHRFISEVRFVTSHPMPFNNQSLRVIEGSPIFHY